MPMFQLLHVCKEFAVPCLYGPIFVCNLIFHFLIYYTYHISERNLSRVESSVLYKIFHMEKVDEWSFKLESIEVYQERSGLPNPAPSIRLIQYTYYY